MIFHMRLLVLIAALVFLPALSLASEGGETAAGEEGAHQEEMVEFFSTGFMWSVINFAVIVFVLYKFGKDPVKEALRQRAEAIRKTLDDAAEARKAAEQGLEEARKRLSEKDAETARILADAKEAAERERVALIEQGERLSKDIVERARLGIDVELKRAKDELRAEAVLLALDLAEKKIREELKDEDQKRLVADYISRVGSKN